ncbi:hypothetical protein FHT44_004986 [Mycolicibacterium sp. BK634]|uniref:hypothetical protein n=1 Tax=Mycolicibacterium sp. BK634 TaxID=2587099 RepID=UPI00161720F3|nr:hypothetical protein [Mycolicibacterium sp. BK634]MBB3752474.1 hypothetical protein [Mycolicibacterium sp. BK634]
MTYYESIEEVAEVIGKLPRVDLELEPVFKAIRAQIDSGSQFDIRVGAIWDRKGYPDGGSVSKEVSPSSYRYSEYTWVGVGVLVGDGWQTDELKSVVSAAANHDEIKKFIAEENARQATRDKVAALRAEADKLEESL